MKIRRGIQENLGRAAAQPNLKGILEHSQKNSLASVTLARSKSLVMGEQNRSPGRSPAPHKLGPVLKAGWLKKQRSIMKNWQQRWFVLRGDQLLYYKDKDESKPQICMFSGSRKLTLGFISLQGTQVTELLPDPEDPGKHLFEITPGIFGQRLEDTVHHERKYGPRLAPLLVEQCVDFIRERGLSEEGLFRMPGQANLVRDLQDSFDCGEKPLFDSTTDVHTVASLLKLYLRELPEPVIPFARYEDFLSCAQLLTKDEGEGTLELAKQVSNLPQANYNLLRYICRFLDEVQAHSNVNKMSVQNLATVFGPNILRPQIEDPVTIMEGTSLVQHLMTVLIRKHGQLFAAASLEEPASPPAAVQRTVEWGSEEVSSDHQGEPGSPGLPTHRTSSLDGPAAAVLSRTSPQHLGSQTGPAATSPGKRMHSLPGWKPSFRQGSRSESPKGGSSSLEVPIISGGNWLINGLSSLRGHRRASSGDRLKDTGSAQRLSTYDNVPPSSHFPSTASMASMLWSVASSSREASVSSCTACRASDSSACSSLHTEWALEPSPLASSSEDHRSPDLGHSLDEACVGSGSSEPNDPGSPTQAHAHRCRALQDQVDELRAELYQQRTEYERSLKSIEEGSADLRKQMSRLEEELDQERKKYTMLEIKLRNSERAREDAERRNQLLQREMEEFFATLGSLTVGTKGTRAPE
ncbi:rho GTPase-activating protein 22 isoform X9 [Mesocricetus auratus]|uniref:Rho GTPase-activating protein 22 isoform X9 n=1 Tax=Mesocricetus auratus TaxID=10036 RepID=A0ABM2XLP2_MESAU|nr:rho GTPase-activating protein 22 isoform X9 [Mesocricetus auratus]